MRVKDPDLAVVAAKRQVACTAPGSRQEHMSQGRGFGHGRHDRGYAKGCRARPLYQPTINNEGHPVVAGGADALQLLC